MYRVFILHSGRAVRESFLGVQKKSVMLCDFSTRTSSEFMSTDWRVWQFVQFHNFLFFIPGIILRRSVMRSAREREILFCSELCENEQDDIPGRNVFALYL